MVAPGRRKLAAMRSPKSRLAAAVLLLAAGPARAADPVLATAGDVACVEDDVNYGGGNGTANHCRQMATSDLLVALDGAGGLDAVLMLGDGEYGDGSLAAWATYDASWGRVKDLTRPAPGNREFGEYSGSPFADPTFTVAQGGYFPYFGAAAGDPAQGYYSFDLGAWHVVVLNSNCKAFGANWQAGCGPDSAQLTWLVADLAANPGRCILAAWHHPRVSSSAAGDDERFVPFWQALDDAGADLILNGHQHNFEVFAPMDAALAADPDGIRQIVSGAGGRSHAAITTVRAQSEIRDDERFGVLELTLHLKSYEWEFLPIAGASAAPKLTGSGACHLQTTPGFHAVEPCRVADTRVPSGQTAGAPLAAGSLTEFPVAGVCGIPAAAAAVSFNLTVVSPGSAGQLVLHASGTATPGTSNLSFKSGQTRANNAIAALGSDGRVAVRADLPSGSAHVVLDVNGYFFDG